MSRKLTDEQYVQRQSLLCPFCDGEDLSYLPASAYQLADNCGGT